MIFLKQKKLAERLCNFFVVERMHDLSKKKKCVIFFVRKGCMIFLLNKILIFLKDFVYLFVERFCYFSEIFFLVGDVT